MTNVVLAGGGTAGHTSPLIATAQELLREPKVSVTCIGTARGLEVRVIPAAGLKLELIDPVPLPRRVNLDLVKLPARLLRSVRQARRILRQAEADVLVGYGGYVSIPAYLAARWLGVPIVVHEANALPGISNKIGSRFASYVATTFPGTPLPGAQRIGMPVSRSISQSTITRAEACEFFGLDVGRPTLLVSGGSQGAVRLNEAVLGAREELLAAGVQVLHVIGPKNFTPDDVVVESVSGARYVPVEFVEDMARAYAAADFMLARAGAGTVVETSMSGLPCLFVPLPYGNGEQGRNAAALVEAGAGVLVDNADLTPDRLLSEVLPRITDAETLERMRQLARNHTPSDAAQRLASAILTVGHQSRKV